MLQANSLQFLKQKRKQDEKNKKEETNEGENIDNKSD